MISERIKCIAKLANGSKKIADVGCDHGYLLIECFNKYNLHSAIAIDNKKMPLESAQKNIMLYSKENIYRVRFSLSSGINDVDSNTDTVVIAGMGGVLITNIIEEGFKTNGKSRYEKMKFILQANRNVSDLRFFLNNNGFFIENEEIIEEDDKYYEIIVCSLKDDIKPLTYSEIEFGPILLKKKDEIFIKKYETEINKLEKIANINTKDINEKIERIRKICL